MGSAALKEERIRGVLTDFYLREATNYGTGAVPKLNREGKRKSPPRGVLLDWFWKCDASSEKGRTVDVRNQQKVPRPGGRE